MELIFEYIGTPSEEEIEQIPNGMWKKLVKSLPKRKKKDFETLFPDANPLGILILYNEELKIFFNKFRFYVLSFGPFEKIAGI